jgi:hypothetical protein
LFQTCAHVGAQAKRGTDQRKASPLGQLRRGSGLPVDLGKHGDSELFGYLFRPVWTPRAHQDQPHPADISLLQQRGKVEPEGGQRRQRGSRHHRHLVRGLDQFVRQPVSFDPPGVHDRVVRG